jgi:EmrB/QacA subfamily drug resistance transporter
MTPQKRWILAAVILGSSIVFLDSTVVNVALPKIGQELPATLVGVLEGQSFVYNGYLLALSSLLILAGALSDSFGRRRMYLTGLIGFGVFSTLCGLAPNMELLILFRILQGAAGALLVPGSLAILTQTFSGEERGRVFGIWAGASAATTLFGPFLGGLLVDFVSWRLAFLINVPLVIVAVYATAKELPERRSAEASGHFDWLGAIVIAVAVGGLSFGAIQGQQTNWTEPLPFIALALGAIATVAFPFLMARSAHPLVPLGLFRSRNFSVTNLSTLLIYGALYVFSYFNSLFLPGTIGYTASASGLSGVPGSIFLVLLSTRFGTLSARYGPRVFMSIGPALMGLGLLWLVRFPADSSPWLLNPSKPDTLLPSAGYLIDVLPALLLFGIGLTIMVAPLTTALMSSVPSENSGIASAINNAISRVGPQLAGAVIFIALTATFYAGLASRVPGLDPNSPDLRQQVSPLNPPASTVPAPVASAAHDASTDSYHLAMLLSAGLLFLGAAVNAVGIRNGVPAGVAADAKLQAATEG